jgi:hypothetical protein
MVQPRQIHKLATKHVLYYMKGTVYYGLRYPRDGELMLHVFVDSS